MKKIVRFFVFSAVLALSSSAIAGIPVIDAGNLTQNIQQVASWVKQYQQMTEQIQKAQQQITQLESTYQSITGSRGFGAILANPGLPEYLPDEWKTIYQTASSGGLSGISGTLAQILADEQASGTIDEQVAKFLLRGRETAATDKAAGLRAYEGAKARLGQIQAIMGQINLTSDPKAIGELQARIASEQAAINNESTKLQMMAMLQQAERNLITEQRQDTNLRILSSGNTTMPGIH